MAARVVRMPGASCSGVQSGSASIPPERIALTGRHRSWTYLLSDVAIRVSTGTRKSATNCACPAMPWSVRNGATRSGSAWRERERPSQRVAVSVW
ncbi:hypothetical protein [Streptomyces akebiae]|uniref:Uncharacterized protein n=1 Tax=Streptomyces akebiae TaxID=2865673 RepID=A0ABX8XJD7_9ACTN|nr:hypothetical protein [Streptomyces akebiae]QYX75664.1 hypothetical protein K1J60_03255 [Streptomyces akebiae]